MARQAVTPITILRAFTWGGEGSEGSGGTLFFLLQKWRDLDELIPMVRSVLDFSYFFDFS